MRLIKVVRRELDFKGEGKSCKGGKGIECVKLVKGKLVLRRNGREEKRVKYRK